MPEDQSGWQSPEPSLATPPPAGFVPPPPPGFAPAGFPPGPPPVWPPTPIAAARSGVPRWLVALVLAVLVLSYGVTVLVTRDIWRPGAPRPVVQASF